MSIEDPTDLTAGGRAPAGAEGDSVAGEEPSATTHPTGTVALLFTDIEGSAELFERHGARFETARREHFQIFREQAPRNHGYEVETAGDSMMLAFDSAADAVAFAVAVQLALRAYPWPEAIGALKVRIGIHTGHPFLGRDRGRVTYTGPVTNRANRIMAAAHGGQILCSNITRDLSWNLLPPEISWRDLNLHRLKGVGEERLWQVQHPELPRAFPPVRTVSGGQAHLPGFLTPFLGRAREVAEVKGLLRAGGARLLLLVGAGGVGKTRLSVRVAEELADLYDDGVWFVALETATTARQMHERIAAQLGIELPHSDGEADGQAEATGLIEALGARKLLLVLDNAEQVEGAAAALDTLVQGARGLQVLVSSRERLAMAGAQVYEIAPLPVPAAGRTAVAALNEVESVQFLVDRARRANQGFAVTEGNAPAVAALCRRLQGVPLALELAAAWFTDLSPQEVLSELETQLDVLSTEYTDLPERQRAIRSSIDWSYTRLPPDEQETFASLGVFAGGCSREAAAAVLHAPLFRVTALLRRLHGKSLLIHGEVEQQARFTMLHTLRMYAAEKLQGLPHAEKLRLRHAEYFRSFADSREARWRSPDEAAALREMEADLDNLRTALEWSVAAGRSRLATQLALGLGRFLRQRGLNREALHTVERGLDAAGSLSGDDPRLHAELWRERAMIYLDQLELERARDCTLDLLALYDGLDDPRGRGYAFNLLGLADYRSRRHDSARTYFNRALAEFQQADDTIGIAQVYNNLGINNKDTGHFDEALTECETSLRLHRQLGDQRGIAIASNNLGTLRQETGDLDAAWRYYTESLQAEQELNNSLGAARVLNNMGETAELQGRTADACRLLAQSYCLFEEIGSPYSRYPRQSLERLTSAPGLAPLEQWIREAREG